MRYPGFAQDIRRKIDRTRRMHVDERHSATFDECRNPKCIDAQEWAALLAEMEKDKAG